MTVEETLVLVKPDGVARNLTGEILRRIEEIPFLRMRSSAQIYLRLKEHREKALLSRMLSAIALDAPVPPHADGMCRLSPDLAAIDNLLEKLRFGPLTRSRLRSFATA